MARLIAGSRTFRHRSLDSLLIAEVGDIVEAEVHVGGSYGDDEVTSSFYRGGCVVTHRGVVEEALRDGCDDIVVRWTDGPAAGLIYIIDSALVGARRGFPVSNLRLAAAAGDDAPTHEQG